jgi:hypothetical protein
MKLDDRGKADAPGKKRLPVALKRPARTCSCQFENVLQDLMSPLFKPAVSHCWRIAEEPWVKLSGTA